MAADNQLNVKIVVDTAQLQTGMAQAASAVEAASAQMASGLQPVMRVSQQTFDNIEGGTLRAREGIALLGEDFGIKIPRAIRGTIAQSELLGAAFSAAFPVFAAITAIEIFGRVYEKLRDLARQEEVNAEAWQKVNHEAANAMDAAAKGIQHLEVRLTELTQGKLAALRQEFKFIGDDAVGMSGKVVALIDQIGVQIGKEIPFFDKVKEFLLATHYGFFPGAVDKIKAFGSELQKSIDTQGIQAGIKLVNDQIERLNAGIAKTPKDTGLAEFRDQLLKVRDLLSSGLEKEGLEKAVNVAEQAKTSAAMIAKEREEADNFLTKMRELARERDRLTRESKALVTEEALFFAKEKEKESADDLKSLGERAAAESKFQEDRKKDAEELSVAGIAAEEKLVEEQLRLGQISNEQARVLLNKLVADKLTIELKYIKDRETAILARMKTDDAKAYAEDAAAWSKLLHDRQQAQVTAAGAIQANDAKTQTAMQKGWVTMFHSIQTGMDQMIHGILMGTQSIGQAFSRLGADLLVIMTQALAKILLKHVAHWVAVNVIEKSAALQSLATLLTGNAAKQATTSATNVAMVTSDAGVAGAAGFASVMAALPFPANVAVAPGVMAAAIASTLSMIPLAAAAGGWDVPGSIPGSGALTLIHPREMVLPASIAQGVRSMTSGGGNSASGGVAPSGPIVHFHINATDARGVQDFFEKHSDKIVSVLRQHHREFKS